MTQPATVPPDNPEGMLTGPEGLHLRQEVPFEGVSGRSKVQFRRDHAGAIVIVGALPVAGGFLLTLYLSIVIDSIKASLEAVEARLQDEEASERLRPKERLSDSHLRLIVSEGPGPIPYRYLRWGKYPYLSISPTQTSMPPVMLTTSAMR